MCEWACGQTGESSHSTQQVKTQNTCAPTGSRSTVALPQRPSLPLCPSRGNINLGIMFCVYGSLDHNDSEFFSLSFFSALGSVCRRKFPLITLHLTITVLAPPSCLDLLFNQPPRPGHLCLSPKLWQCQSEHRVWHVFSLGMSAFSFFFFFHALAPTGTARRQWSSPAMAVALPAARCDELRWRWRPRWASTTPAAARVVGVAPTPAMMIAAAG